MEFPNIQALDFGVPIGLDFETSGLDYWNPNFHALDVAIAVPGATFSFDFRSTPNLGAWLRDVLPGRTVASHSAQFEYQVCRRLGINPRSINWHCTMVSQCLIYEHDLQYNLAAVAAANGIESNKTRNLRAIMDHLGVDTSSAALARLSEVPSELRATYVGGDAADALQIYLKQVPQIGAQELGRVYDLEHRLLPVLADMSWGGVKVDLERAHAAIPKLTEKIDELQRKLNDVTGTKFNANSSPQIRAIFQPKPINKFQYQLVDGTIVGATKGNKGPSIDQNALREMQHPAAALIVALRKTIKLRDTFIRGHIIASADGNGFVHTSFNQTKNDADAGTGTGRLSSTGPALQQITKRDKENAALLRSMFIPDSPDEDWCCEDYSQVDFRCGAHLINEPGIIEAYRQNPDLDYHQVVSDMTGIPRNAPYAGAPYAKQMNLGMQFGAGPGKVCFMMKMPYELVEKKGRAVYMPGPEGKAVFELYHQKLPGVKRFSKHAENVAKDSGYVKTQIGRRLRFPRGFGAHKAAGLLYQAYAADLHKIGLVATDKRIREFNLPARLSLSVHDEMGLSIEKGNTRVMEEIRGVYTDFNRPDSEVFMRVPITASAKLGANWWEASKD
jgi:DNA polymerase I-like protein with 3'-5' exonuclease and polymerase domains